MLSKKKNKTRTLEYFCQNNFSLKTKIALLSFYKIRYSEWIEKIIILFEYLQLITQALTVFFKSESDGSHPHSSLTRLVFYFFKIICPSYLLDFLITNDLTNFSLVIVLCYTILKLCLLVGVTFVAKSNKYDPNSILLKLWQWVFKLQGRVAYLFVTSFWMGAVMKNYSWFGMGEWLTIFISCLMIAVELAFSLFLETQFCYVLPTKNFLASKSPEMPVMTLIQKFTVQVLIMGSRASFTTTAWVTAIVNLLFSLVRNYRFYATLPFYKFQALLFHGDLLSLVTAMNFAGLFQIIVWAIKDNQDDVNLVVIVWIILSILMMKAFQEIAKQTLTNLLTEKSKSSSCEVLLHKLVLFRQINKDERLPDIQTEKYDFIHLLNISLSQNLQHVFELNGSEYLKVKSSVGRKELIKRIFLAYIDNLSERAPKNTLVKLLKARAYSKCPELYATAIRIAAGIKENYWSKNYVTSCFLLYEIQRTILSNYEDSVTKLSLFPFTENKVKVEKLKDKVLKTTENKIVICNNILGDMCNIGTIFNSSQQISDNVGDITKQIEILANNLPDGYISPFLIFAEFHVLINYSIKDFKRFHDLYFQRLFKNEKQFLEMNLIQENLYQEENAFLILSGEKIRTGQIIYCSDSTENLFGQDKNTFINSHVLDLFPHCLRSYYDDLFRQIFETGDKTLINKTFKTFMLNRNEHLVEVEFFLRIHPFITQSLCLQMLIRPTPSEGEFLLLRKDGNLEGVTEKFSRSFGIRPNIHIGVLSEQLFKVNQAFNMIQEISSEDDRNSNTPKTPKNNGKELKYEDAKVLFDAFTQKGKKVEINMNNIKGQSNVNFALTYFCKVSMLNLGNISMKLVHLQEINEFDELTYVRTLIKSSVAIPDYQEEGSENIECYEREMESDKYDSSKRVTSLMFAEKELTSARIGETTQGDVLLILCEGLQIYTLYRCISGTCEFD